MAHTRGMVIRTGPGGTAEVMVERSGACSGCGRKQSCHSCLSHAKTQIEALNIAGASAGDLVSLSIPSDTLIKGAAVLYLIPVIGLLTGAFSGPDLGRFLALKETPASILFGLAGLTFGFLVTSFLSGKMSKNQGLTPRIDRIIASNTEPFKLTASNFTFKTNLDP